MSLVDVERRGGGGRDLNTVMAAGRRTKDSNEGDGNGVCGTILTILSLFLIVITFPFSLCLVIKMVQVKKFFNASNVQHGKHV